MYDFFISLLVRHRIMHVFVEICICAYAYVYMCTFTYVHVYNLDNI